MALGAFEQSGRVGLNKFEVQSQQELWQHAETGAVLQGAAGQDKQPNKELRVRVGKLFSSDRRRLMKKFRAAAAAAGDTDEQAQQSHPPHPQPPPRATKQQPYPQAHRQPWPHAPHSEARHPHAPSQQPQSWPQSWPQAQPRYQPQPPVVGRTMTAMGASPFQDAPPPGEAPMHNFDTWNGRGNGPKEEPLTETLLRFAPPPGPQPWPQRGEGQVFGERAPGSWWGNHGVQAAPAAWGQRWVKTASPGSALAADPDARQRQFETAWGLLGCETLQLSL